jgi:hypothetical protein
MSVTPNDPIKAAIDKAKDQLAADLGVSPSDITASVFDAVADHVSTQEPERGPFVFYEAQPIPHTGAVREAIIAQMCQSEPSMNRESAEAYLQNAERETLVMSTVYQVAMKNAASGFGFPVVHLSIKRIDREPMHDWRALQTIKNVLVGEEFEAIEIYPAESRLVDSANQYHLWVFNDPLARIPIGWGSRLVDEIQVGHSKQRRFESRDALLPSKAELIDALRPLCDWMRDNTGPSDGTLEILSDAKTLLDKVDKARVS